MRIAVFILCLEVALLLSARISIADAQVEWRWQPDIITKYSENPVSVQRGRTEVILDVENDTRKIFRTRENATIENFGKKLWLERSNHTVYSPILQTEGGKESLAIEENPDRVYQTLITKGWELYRAEEYLNAKKMFINAGESGATDIRRQSELGLAYSLIQLGEKLQAINHLNTLVQERYLLQTTSDTLAQLLLETGRLNDARQILQHLPRSRRVVMQEEIEERSLRRRMDQAITEDDLTLLLTAIRDARPQVESCLETEYFFQAALAMSQLGAISDARSLLIALGNCRKEDKEWQIRLLSKRLAVLDDMRLIVILSCYAGSNLYGPELVRIGRGEIWKRLDKLPENDPVRQSLIESLLMLDPDDVQVMSMLAWSCFQQGNYGCSERYFRQLLKNEPTDSNFLEGLCLTLIKSGCPFDALMAIESFEGEPSGQVRNLLVSLYSQLGFEEYERGNNSSAAHYLAAALEYDPEQRDLLEVLHWARYKDGQAQGLVDFLFEEYEKNPSPERAEAYLDILRETGQLKKQILFIANLAKHRDQRLRRIAAKEYYDRGWVMLAASTDDTENVCYSDCDRPLIDNMVSMRMRNGENGTSRLDVVAYSAAVHLQASQGRRWDFRLTPAQIDSGKTVSQPYVGSYYRVLEDPDQEFEELKTDYDVFEPELGFVQEGERFWQILVGTTALGGPVNPLPTFSATVQEKQWRIKLNQESVRESALSWIGIEDPYSQNVWGRVLRTGISIQNTVDLKGAWWLSVEGDYHYYWGENVIDNQQLAASLSWGRTDPWYDLSRTVGLFASVKGFEHNTNFFTYGHGGYYSPEQMIILGPFIRLTSKSDGRFWWDGQLGLGYSYRRTESAPHYGEYVEGLTTAANNDITQMYEGATESQISVDGHLRGLYSLGSSWFVGIEAGINNSSDFTEIQAGVFLRYRFGKGEALCVSPAKANTSFIPLR